MNLIKVGNLTLPLPTEVNINGSTSPQNTGASILNPNFKTGYTIAMSHFLVIGLLGNLIVVYVVLRFATMQTVTNIHLLSLALADILYLISMPFFLTIINMEVFIFGWVGCKIYMMLNGVNWFAGTYSLTIMSIDRYLAVVHPIRSQSFRTPKIAVFLVIGMWLVCFLVMLPVLMYSDVTQSTEYNITQTCIISFPGSKGSFTFILYAFLLGFLLPVVAISFFYSMVIHRLRTVGPKNKSKERRDSHRRITRLVLAIIIIYVVLWLPYWTQQLLLLAFPRHWLGNIYLAFTVHLLSYANCAVNPFLYAFISQNFRGMFQQLLCCPTMSLQQTGITHQQRTVIEEDQMERLQERRRSELNNSLPEDNRYYKQQRRNTRLTDADEEVDATNFLLTTMARKGSNFVEEEEEEDEITGGKNRSSTQAIVEPPAQNGKCLQETDLCGEDYV